MDGIKKIKLILIIHIKISKNMNGSRIFFQFNLAIVTNLKNNKKYKTRK